MESHVDEETRLTLSYDTMAASSAHLQNSVEQALQNASACRIRTTEVPNPSLKFIMHLWCSYCEFSTDNKQELVTHMNANHMKTCPHCPFRSISQADVARHIDHEHNSTVQIQCLSNTEMDMDPVSICDFCSFMTHSREHFQRHTSVKHPGVLPKSTSKVVPKHISARVRQADANFYSWLLNKTSGGVSCFTQNRFESHLDSDYNGVHYPRIDDKGGGERSVYLAKDHESPVVTSESLGNYNGSNVPQCSYASVLLPDAVSDQNQSATSRIHHAAVTDTSHMNHQICPDESQDSSASAISKDVSKDAVRPDTIKLENGRNDRDKRKESSQTLLSLDRAHGALLNKEIPVLDLKIESPAPQSGKESDVVALQCGDSDAADDDDEPQVFFQTDQVKKQKSVNSTHSPSQKGNHQDAAPMVVDLNVFHPCNKCSLAFASSILLEEHAEKQHREEDRRETRRTSKRKLIPIVKLEILPEKYAIRSTSVSLNSVAKPKAKLKTRGRAPRRDRTRVVRKTPGEETPFKCDVCGKSFTKSETLHYHQMIHTGEKKFSCDECGRKFRWSSHLRRHEKLHSNERMFKCTVCGKSFVQGYTLVIHMRSHTGERPFQCSYCGKGFKSKYEHIVHTRIHTGEKPYRCKLCDRSYAQSSSLDIHMRSHKRKQLLLKEEKERVEQLASGLGTLKLKSHQRRISKPGKRVPQPCRECGKLLQPGSLWRHLRTHAGVRPYKCSKCGHDFLASDDLKKHMKMVHTKDRPYRCHLCDKTYKDGHNLKRHIRSHTGEKPFQCTQCDKRYQNVESLRVHMSIHTGEQRLLCNVCGKHFRWGGHLRRHMKIHTGERPYECVVCGARFGQKNDLQKHANIHREKPYKCSICGKSFRSHSTYLNHVEKHPGGQLFSCSMCDRRFHRRGTLQQHVRRVHNNRKAPSQMQAPQVHVQPLSIPPHTQQTQPPVVPPQIAHIMHPPAVPTQTQPPVVPPQIAHIMHPPAVPTQMPQMQAPPMPSHSQMQIQQSVIAPQMQGQPPLISSLGSKLMAL